MESDSSAGPVIMIVMFIILGGIVAWGAMTEWTFSGLLPKEGAKCTPDKDDKDENATKYVYDEDEECTVIETCKEDWKPDESNTACISSISGTSCEFEGTKMDKGVYKWSPTNACEISSCTGNFELPDCDTCKTGYTLTDGSCVATPSPPPPPPSPPPNSTPTSPPPPPPNSTPTSPPPSPPTPIPDATSCNGWDCEIEGQFCPQGVPGASTDSYTCSNKKWVKNPPPPPPPPTPSTPEQVWLKQLALEAARKLEVARNNMPKALRAAWEGDAPCSSYRGASLGNCPTNRCESKSRSCLEKCSSYSGDDCPAGRCNKKDGGCSVKLSTYEQQLADAAAETGPPCSSYRGASLGNCPTNRCEQRGRSCSEKK